MAKPPIDDRTLDRLVSGSMEPEDAPPGYDQVARVLQAAQAPAGGSELARERIVVSMAAAAVSGPVEGALTFGHPRRKRAVSKLATVRAALITAAAVLGAGAAAAAATGSLPSQTSNASSHASGLLTAGSNVTTATTGKNSSPNSNPNSFNPLNLPTTGAGNFHAVIGLCTAFVAHNSTATSVGGAAPTSSTPPENDSTAFTALRKDAGNGTEASVSATVAWCNSYLSSNSPGNSGSTNGGAAPAGKPSSPGNSGSHTSGNPGSGDTANSASHGDSLAGTSTANSVSGGASSAGSANPGRR